MNTTNEHDLHSLAYTWWRRICGLQFDLSSKDGASGQSGKLLCAGVESFLGLRPLCVLPHYLGNRLPQELFSSLPECVISGCIGHALSAVIFPLNTIIHSLSKIESIGDNAEQWWDEFLHLVEVQPMSIAATSKTCPELQEFYSWVQLRRMLNSIPRAERFGELSDYLPYHRIAIGSDLRMIDPRVRVLWEEPRMAASFLFDDYLYSNEGAAKGTLKIADLHRMSMLLCLEHSMQIVIPREAPEALSINDPIHTERDYDLALRYRSCAPLPVRYLDLQGAAGAVCGVYIKG